MVTSGIGFGSLATSSMEATRHFGLFAVIGIVMAFILTVGPFSLFVMHFCSSLKRPRLSLDIQSGFPFGGA